MSAAIRAPGRAIVTKTNALLHPEGSRQCGGSAGDAAQGPRWKPLPALQRSVSDACQCVGGKAKVRMAPRSAVPAGARLFSWLCECRSVGRSRVAACVRVPALGECTRTAGEPGMGGRGAPRRAPHPYLLIRMLQGIGQPGGNCCLCQNKNLSVCESQRAPSKTGVQRKSSRVVSGTAGREVAESPVVPTPTSPDPSPSGTAAVVSGSKCICTVSLLPSPKPPCLLSPGCWGGVVVLVSRDPLHPPYSTIPFTAPYQERRAGRNRQMNNLL